MGMARKYGREQNNNININNISSPICFPRDSEEASAKGGSREESWVGELTPFVLHAACLGISLQAVPRSNHLGQLMGCAYRNKPTFSTWIVVILSDVANSPSREVYD